jgi:predicted acetyltransferase
MTNEDAEAEIRPITEPEFAAWLDAMHTGFLDHAAPGEAAFRLPSVDFARALGAFDGDRVVGTFRSFPTELTVPGGARLPADAVTNVAVLGSHRRRGLLSRMMERDLGAARERGDAVAILIASEYPIYGRFGFGPATVNVSYAVDTNLASLVRPVEPDVELVDGKAFRELAPGIYDRHQSVTAGEIGRMAFRWEVLAGLLDPPGADLPKRHRVVARDAEGTPAGYLVFHVEADWSSSARPTHTLTVDELIAPDHEVEARLWAFCFTVDLVATVKAENRAEHERLPWLLRNARAMWEASRWDFLWVRVLDVPVALAARTYPRQGGVVLEVVDPMGFAGGRFALEGGPESATCEATNAQPDLTLSVRTLGSAYLGRHSLRLLAESGLVQVHDPNALSVAEAMFSTPVAPWCTTWF